MTITPETIQKQTFKERFKGYDEEEVDDFLARLADGIAELIRERDTLSDRVRVLEDSAGSATETEQLLRKTLVAAQRTADDTVAEARSTAEQTVADAREEAEHLLAEARDEAERLRTAAREQAQAETGRAREHVELVRAAVDDLRRLRADYADRVRAIIAEQLDLLDRTGDIPDLPPALEALGSLPDPGAGGDEPEDVRAEQAGGVLAEPGYGWEGHEHRR